MSGTASGVRAILANGVALFLAYALPRVFTVGSVVVAARLLGAEGFGAYGTAAALAVILSILCTLGMAPLLVREIARDPASASGLLRGAHLVKSGAGAAMMVVLLAVTWGVGYPADVRGAAILLGVGYWLGSYAENLAAWFQGVERMRVCSEAGAALGIVSGTAGLVLVLVTRSPVWFAAAFALGQAAALAWYLVRAPIDVRRGARVGGPGLRRLLGDALPFAVAFVALTVHYKLDVLVVERVGTPVDVGVYAAAYKFVDVFHALVLVAVGALFPRLSRAAAARTAARTAGRWAATRATELVLLAAVPAAAVLWLLRVPLVEGLFGPAYGASVPVLTLLAPVLPALALNLHGGYVLGAAGRMATLGWLYAGSAAVKAGMVVVATSRWGPVGAAGGVLSAEVLLATAMVLVLGRVAGSAPGGRPVLLAALAAVLAPSVRVVLGGAGVGWVGLAYAAAVFVLYTAGGALPVGERRALRGALRGTFASRRPGELAVGGPP
jgi:O-antigen/teichoic acid export membrane protein